MKMVGFDIKFDCFLNRKSSGFSRGASVYRGVTRLWQEPKKKKIKNCFNDKAFHYLLLFAAFAIIIFNNRQNIMIHVHMRLTIYIWHKI